MKRFLVLMLVLSMALCSFAACGEDKEESDEEKIESDEKESEVVSSDGGNTDDAIGESDGKITISSIAVGDICTFGTYEQDNMYNGVEPIEWIVLDKTDDKMLVISKYALDCQPYNNVYENATWETCSLRTWLNDTFINTAFTASQQEKILTTNVIAEDNPRHGTEAGNDTQDKIFLLSISEAEKYFANDNARECQATEYAKARGAGVNTSNTYEHCWWLMRSPGSWPRNATFVRSDGDIGDSGHDVNNTDDAVRPAMWVISDGISTDDTTTTTEDGSKSESDGKVTTSAIKVGDTYTFGAYEQDDYTSNGKEDIEWIVLDKTDTSILVISKYALDCQPYNKVYTNVTWETCSLRTWLNNDFYNSAFTTSQQTMILATDVMTDYGTEEDNDTQDKIFLLSISEAEKYFADNESRECQLTKYAKTQGAYTPSSKTDDDYENCYWWLRSSGDLPLYASFVFIGGGINDEGDFVDNSDVAVRPAMWITIE